MSNPVHCHAGVSKRGVSPSSISFPLSLIGEGARGEVDMFSNVDRLAFMGYVEGETGNNEGG